MAVLPKGTTSSRVCEGKLEVKGSKFGATPSSVISTVPKVQIDEEPSTTFNCTVYVFLGEKKGRKESKKGVRRKKEKVVTKLRTWKTCPMMET